MGRRKSEGSKRLGEFIRQLRQRSGISQHALAQMIGISYQQVQKYEYGKCELSLGRAISLARALDVTIETLIGELDGDIVAGRKLSLDEVRLLDIYRRHKDEKIVELILNTSRSI